MGYYGSLPFVVTPAYVQPRSPVLQGSYLRLPVMRWATSFVIEMVTTQSGICHSYAALSEVEIFADGQNEYDR